MIEKENVNLKNKINLKTFLSKNIQTSFNSQRINIQTITKDKSQKFFYEGKKNVPKLSNKIRYLKSTIAINNLNNNYLLNDDQISFFSLYNSNKEPSTINSNLNSSPYSTYTQKKGNYKRFPKKPKHRYNNYNTNSSSSIKNLNLNSKIMNTNQSDSLSASSSPSSSKSSSSSSDLSYQSRENKRKKYKEIMMAEEDDMDYLKKREVGLLSSDEEENENSIGENNSLEEYLSNEIERILIEIYNKNISRISSGNSHNSTKKRTESEEVERQIKKYLKKRNFKINLLVLKYLSNKIKELVEKYKEKIFEIEEIKTIYNESKKKIELFRNNQILHSNNSVGSNVATNSNSSYDSGNYIYDEENFMNNNLLLNVQDEIRGKGISNILLHELINIKNTLKISSKEIKSIFKYPLSLLKNEKGKKIKFSIELMQAEEFCKTILSDEFIYILLSQMKSIFTQIPITNMTELIDEVLENYDNKNEMTRFVNFINNKLSMMNDDNNINDSNNDNNKEVNDYLEKYEIKDNNSNNNNIEEEIRKNNGLSLETASSIDDIPFKNEKISNNNSGEKQKQKKKEQKKKKNENKNDTNNKVDFKDIDELLNYINDETDSKKGKKKGKKGKKNKKDNSINKDQNNELINNENNFYENEEDFEKFFEDFKRDIEKNSIFVYEINKIEPNLSKDFINNKCSN